MRPRLAYARTFRTVIPALAASSSTVNSSGCGDAEPDEMGDMWAS